MLSLKRILGCLIVLSVLVLCGVIWRHIDQQDPEQLIEMLPDDIDLALQDLHYTHSEAGVKRWTLDADKAEYLKESSLAKLEKVNLTYFQTRSFGDIYLEADQGRLNQASRELDIWGDVVLTTDNGEKFYTERLHYDERERSLTTEDPVRIVSPRLELTGVGMKVEIDRGYMIVKDRVRALLQPEDDTKGD